MVSVRAQFLSHMYLTPKPGFLTSTEPVFVQSRHPLKQLQFQTEGIIQLCLIVCYVTRCLNA